MFGCEVTRAAWQQQDNRWELSTSKGPMTADVLIGAFGALAEPSLPSIPGIDDFDGELFHSAQWNHDADLAGKRVAVIGTGASAIQLVPAIADTVAHIDVYQRTAPWLLPRFDRAFNRVERWAFRNIPATLRLARAAFTRRARVRSSGWPRTPA